MNPHAYRNRPSRSVRCPQCDAQPGAPCHDKEGVLMPGVHFQRRNAVRNAARIALHLLYAPIGYSPNPRRIPVKKS